MNQQFSDQLNAAHIKKAQVIMNAEGIPFNINIINKYENVTKCQNSGYGDNSLFKSEALSGTHYFIGTEFFVYNG